MGKADARRNLNGKTNMLLNYLEAIRQGIWEEMERDPTVFCRTGTHR